MTGNHYPDQDKFHAIRSEDVEWRLFAAFPPAARLAVLIGDPAQPGPYVIRVKLPAGTRMSPHKHPEDRVYTVISGVFYRSRGGVRRKPTTGFCARERGRPPGRTTAFSLGEIRRIHHPGERDRTSRSRIRQFGRRSAPRRLVRHAFARSPVARCRVAGDEIIFVCKEREQCDLVAN